VSQGAALLLFLVLIPYATPLLSEEQAWWWDVWVVNLLLYGTALTAILWIPTASLSKRERRFWRLLALSMGSIVALYAVGLVSLLLGLDLYARPAMDLVDQGAYLAFYLGFFLALDDSSPGWGKSSPHELRWVRTAGLGVLLGGTWAYFSAAPVILHRQDEVGWISILLTYAAVDVLLCLEYWRARSQSIDPRWRSILGWVGLALGAWAVVDFWEAAIDLEWLAWIPGGSSLELQWYVPIFLFVLGARINLTAPAPPRDDDEEASALLSGGPLVLYAVTLPILHFLLYGAGVLAPELRTLREMVALVVALLTGGLAWVYQRSVERQNRNTHRQLQRSREQYRTFVETSVEGIWLMTFDPPVATDASEDEQMAQIFRRGRVVESNDAMAHMYEYRDASETQGLPLSSILRSVKNHPTNVESVRRFIRAGYKVIRAPLDFLDSTGTLRRFEGSLVGAVENGALVRAWATQVDVTVRYEAEAAKDAMERQLRRTQRLETIGTLAGGIAHDFNNMLSPILGFTELAEETVPPEDTETHEYLAQVTLAATRAKALVGQILAVGRHQEGTREPIRLSQIVDEAIDLLRQSLPAYIAFQTTYDPDCPPVMADAGQLHQVVMNLCTNARQAIGDRAGTVRVTVDATDVGPDTGGTSPAGPWVRLTVEDDGAGMSQATLDRAFEAFFTTKPLGEGSGLGLSVSHGIVEGHGGHIQVESTVGVGTTFTVLLPATSAAVSEADGPAHVTHSGFPGVRAMLVDDDAAVAALGRVMLEGLGCKVTALTDSEVALETLTHGARDFDLLVTDHTMPRVTGPQLAAMARSQNPRIAVVLASGYHAAEQSAVTEGLTLLAKPFTRLEFETKIAAALSESYTDVVLT
jgi:signal transduction histidine kinase/CheY-like chemotaxis protein